MIKIDSEFVSKIKLNYGNKIYEPRPRLNKPYVYEWNRVEIKYPEKFSIPFNYEAYLTQMVLDSEIFIYQNKVSLIRCGASWSFLIEAFFRKRN